MSIVTDLKAGNDNRYISRTRQGVELEVRFGPYLAFTDAVYFRQRGRGTHPDYYSGMIAYPAVGAEPSNTVVTLCDPTRWPEDAAPLSVESIPRVLAAKLELAAIELDDRLNARKSELEKRSDPAEVTTTPPQGQQPLPKHMLDARERYEKLEFADRFMIAWVSSLEGVVQMSEVPSVIANGYKVMEMIWEERKKRFG